MIESSLARWLRRMVYAGAFIPLVIFAQYTSPFHFGKVIVFRTLVQVMVALYLLLIWRDRSYLPKSHPITWTFFGFAVAFSLATITSVAPFQSFWGTLERMGGLFAFWHYFFFYLITLSLLRTREHWRTLIDLMISVGVVSALYGFLQKTNLSFIIGADGRARPFGTIGNAALFAGYQLVLLFFTATLLRVRSWWQPVHLGSRSTDRGGMLIGGGLMATIIVALLSGSQGWWVIPLGVVVYGVLVLLSASMAQGGMRFYQGAAILFLIAVLSTAVRGAILGLIVGIFVFLLLRMSIEGGRKLRRMFIWLVVAIALFIFFAVMLRNTPLVQNSGYLKRITDFSSKTFTVQTRLWTWTSGLQGWAESPKTMLLGWGPENFNIPFSRHFDPRHFTGLGAETSFDRAHNMFIEVLVTMGLVGVLAYGALFGAIFWTLFRFLKRGGDVQALGIGCISLVVAYMIHDAFIFDTSVNFITFFMVLGFIVHIAMRGFDDAPPAGNKSKVFQRSWTNPQKVVAGILAAIVAVTVYIVNLKPVFANYTTTRAMLAGWEGDFDRAIQKYEKAIAYDTQGRYEFRHQLAKYLLQVSVETDIRTFPPFEPTTLRVIEHIKKSIEESPQDHLPLLYIAKLYLVLGKYDAASPYNDHALAYAERARVISPTFVRTYYEIGQAYLNKHNFTKAFEAFKYAAELNPTMGLSWWYAGVTRSQDAIERGSHAGIRESLGYMIKAVQNGYIPEAADTQRVIALFLQVNDIAGIAAFYEELVQRAPKNIFFWEQLAAAYIRLGQYENVIRVLRVALETPGVGDNPEFRAKAIGTLQQLGVD